MKGIVAILGLTVMFTAIPPRAAPLPAAAAGAVLFTEGKALELAPEPLPPAPQPTPAPVPRPIVIDADGLAESVGRFLSRVTPPKPAEVAKAEEPAPIDPTWLKAVYPFRLTGTSTNPRTRGMVATAGGSAVAVGPAKLHTVSHLSHELSGYRAEVQVDGQWKPATFAPVPGKDMAVLTMVGVELEAVPVRAPEYGEPVTVYGLATRSFAQGRYIGDLNPAVGSGTVPLEVGQAVTQEGDSGGGVFGDDGKLLGTLTGKSHAEERVAFMVPIVADAPAQTAPAARTPPPARAVQNCPGGVCPAPAFQPVQQQPQEKPRFLLRALKH
jgi:hypothetical protein